MLIVNLINYFLKKNVVIRFENQKLNGHRYTFNNLYHLMHFTFEFWFF